MKKGNRLLAVLLSLVITLTYMPAMAFATDGDGTSNGSWKYVEDNWGVITINNGEITARGNGNGAGIGGGNHTSSGQIVINGGNIDARGETGIG